MGFYLVGDGLPELEAASQVKVSALESLGRRSKLTLYLGGIALITALATGAILALAGVLLMICTSSIAISITNWAATVLVRPIFLPPAQLSLLILGWTIMNTPWFWTIMATAIILFPLVIYFLIGAFQGQSELPWRLRLRASTRSLGRQLLQAGLNLIFLPYEAYFSLDVVLRSWNRMLFAHRHLLE